MCIQFLTLSTDWRRRRRGWCSVCFFGRWAWSRSTRLRHLSRWRRRRRRQRLADLRRSPVGRYGGWWRPADGRRGGWWRLARRFYTGGTPLINHISFAQSDLIAVAQLTWSTDPLSIYGYHSVDWNNCMRTTALSYLRMLGRDGGISSDIFISHLVTTNRNRIVDNQDFTTVIDPGGNF